MTSLTRLDAPLVVGAGVAGLSTALALGRAYVLTVPDMGSTWLAQSGIASALAPEDSPSDHASDTLAAADGLAVPEVVEMLTAEGPAAIERLVAAGAGFDRDVDGRLVLAAVAGHTRPRAARADGDAVGAEVMRALNASVAGADGVDLIEGRVVDLARSGSRVVGAVTADGKQRHVYVAPAVVMATGGAGRIYSRTTNPLGVTGEGIVMAARAGARLADLEFTQFHPTTLLAGKDPMPPLSETLRREGAVLVDAHGRRFMGQYHPRAELAPGDVVARAILTEQGRGSSTYMDARTIPNFSERFPTVTAHALSVGLEPTQHLLPVSPAAHYLIGGIAADMMGRTSVEGLWAVGECTSTGAHGANRLGGNSLLEGVVFAARAAADIAATAGMPSGEVTVPGDSLDLPVIAGPAIEDLRSIMWERSGPIRSGDSLEEGRQAILSLETVLNRTIAGRNACLLASMMLTAAQARTESRGWHHRTDFPDTDPAQDGRASFQPDEADTVVVAG